MREREKERERACARVCARARLFVSPARAFAMCEHMLVRVRMQACARVLP